MAAETVNWPWLYQPGSKDPDKIKDTLKELVEDEVDLADLDFSQEEFQNKITGCVASIEGRISSRSAEEVDEPFEVNYKNKVIKLPSFVSSLLSVDSQVKASDVRYARVVKGKYEGVGCDDDEIVLFSIWSHNGKEIVNIYLRTPGLKECLILVSSISKLLYEACGKNTLRLKKFQPVEIGTVQVSTCSVEERDKREKAEFDKMKKEADAEKKASGDAGAGLESDSVDETGAPTSSEDLKPLEERKMYFVLDEEALCLYDHPLSSRPVHDFRFYKESLECSIDVIYVCNSSGELEIEQQEKVYYIKSGSKEGEADENFANLSKLLREGTMRPKPQEIFTDLQKFISHFSDDQRPKSKPAKPDTRPSEGGAAKHTTEGPPQWLQHLLSGNHLINGDEELQILWFQIEHQLTDILRDNAIPETAMESTGINPENYDHLRTAVEDIREKLLNQNFLMALSHLEGTLKVFGNSLLRTVHTMDKLELLKRIFFLSG